MKRMIGLDFGAKTVGVAVSDGLGLLAHGVETIHRKSESKLRQTLARIEALIAEKNVQMIVLGMPYHLNGECGIRVEKTLAFKAMLEKRTGLEVVLVDERLTTREAYEKMDEAGIYGKERSERIDEMAAIIILQSYLDQLRAKKEKINDENHRNS